jgi:hypothetical protein
MGDLFPGKNPPAGASGQVFEGILFRANSESLTLKRFDCSTDAKKPRQPERAGFEEVCCHTGTFGG